MGKICNCELHIRVEASEPNKPHIPCVGHGEGCPCTERLNKEAAEKLLKEQEAK